MSDFFNEIQADELVDGNFYDGEYQPTDQDLADMAEAWDSDLDEGEMAEYEAAHAANLDWDWMADDADALTSAGHGTDEDYGGWGDTGEYDCNDW